MGIKRAIASCGGECDWSVPAMAAWCGISRSQFQKNRAVIVEQRRLILLTERPGTQHRHATNLWKMPQLGEGGRVSLLRPVLKPLETVLKTHTQALTRPVEKNLSVRPKPEPQTRPGIAFSQREQNHPMKFREGWKRRQEGRRIREEQLEKARQRCRRASIGMWTPPAGYTPPTAEQEAANRERMEEAERQREAARKSEAERIREEREAWWARERERVAALCPRCGGGGRREQITALGTLRFVDCECKLGGNR